MNTTSVELDADELLTLRLGLKELDPAKQEAVNSVLDAKLYFAQCELEK